jgi:hypothetical protein
VNLYSKLKKSHLNKLHDAILISNKPFNYSASFKKQKKPSVSHQKMSVQKTQNTLKNKRMSLFSNTCQIKNEIGTYTPQTPIMEFNKTVDMLLKNPVYPKQKPAAPEISRNLQIAPSFSDSMMIPYSNNSSIKTFTRPKSMERIKRKRKSKAKSKGKRKTKRKEMDTSTTSVKPTSESSKSFWKVMQIEK